MKRDMGTLIALVIHIKVKTWYISAPYSESRSRFIGPFGPDRQLYILLLDCIYVFAMKDQHSSVQSTSGAVAKLFDGVFYQSHHWPSVPQHLVQNDKSLLLM